MVCLQEGSRGNVSSVESKGLEPGIAGATTKEMVATTKEMVAT